MKGIVLGLLAGGLLLPGMAQAVDYDRFVVPVRVSGIHPDVRSVGVGCYLKDPEDNVVATGQAWGTLSGGAFDGDLSVAARDSGSHPRWRATRWYCVLKFTDPYASASMSVSQYRTRFGVDASATLVDRVEGTIAP
jgi:hypothetical protein